MKIFGHKRKPEEGEQIGTVQRMQKGGIGRLWWEEAPRCKVPPSLVYKRKGGPHVMGFPILLGGGIPLRSRVLLVQCLSRVSKFSFFLLLPHLVSGGEETEGRPPSQRPR